MYAVHPYRVFNVARGVLDNVDLSSARAGFLADPRAHKDNTDWNQGIMDGTVGAVLAASFCWVGCAPHHLSCPPFYCLHLQPPSSASKIMLSNSCFSAPYMRLLRVTAGLHLVRAVADCTKDT